MRNSTCTIIGLFVFANCLLAQTIVPAGSIQLPSEYEVRNLEELNSTELDYSAVPFRNGIVFTSTRGKDNLFSCSGDFASGNYSDLYFSRADGEGIYTTPELLEGNVNSKYHDGTATFPETETSMLFSRNNSKGPNSWGTIDLKIYEGKLKNGSWTTVGELPFNSNEYATCHPSVTPNDQWLYFASNRPGGYGGMDIYVVERQGDSWGMPINLGPKVNTSGHELFPFFSPTGILYWSSDGLPGMGGLDIFSIPIANGKEPVRNHLSAPINSTSDDFAFTTNPDGTRGFLTSNREGGMGKDDLYSWRFKGIKPQMATICVVDKKSGGRIEDAVMDIDLVPIQQPYGSGTVLSENGISYLQMQAMNVDGKEYLVLVPYQDDVASVNGLEKGKSCDVKFPVIPGRLYKVTVEKEGYQPYQKTVTAEEMLSNPEWLVPIEVQGPVALKGKVRDKLDNTPIALADIKVVNSCTGEKLELTANQQGEFRFPMDCNCDYEVIASKGDYHYDYEILYSYDMPCDRINSTVLLYLEKNRKAPKPEYEVGKVIRLDHLYYDYDKFFIRSDASEELDKVVELLREYPSMEIELSSHTDARGSDEYNRWLSQKRADAAVDYIISRGISRQRVIAAGYGEGQLVNHCRNNVNCSDAEHQQNRRTEIRVTKFDEKGVRVED